MGFPREAAPFILGTPSFCENRRGNGGDAPLQSRAVGSRLICIDSVHAGRPLFYETDGDGDLLELTYQVVGSTVPSGS